MTTTYKLGKEIPNLAFGQVHTLPIQVFDLPVPPLAPGTKGAAVKELQAALVKLGRLSAASESGTYDPITERAVGKLQREWGMTGAKGYDSATHDLMAHALNGEKPPAGVGPPTLGSTGGTPAPGTGAPPPHGSGGTKPGGTTTPPKKPHNKKPTIAAVEKGEETIELGDSGAAVKKVQELLGLPDDGDFGKDTKDALIAFQKHHGISSKEYGVVDAHTYKLLTEHPVDTSGSTEAIRAAADQLDKMNLPYVYGGGHGSTPATPSGFENGHGPGMDCSASVSWVLQHAGVKLNGRMPPTSASGAMESWFESGHAGQAGVLIYASGSHVFMIIKGRVFSSNSAYENHGGPHWKGDAPGAISAHEPTENYTIRHVTGTR